ncbi:MAG TPA: DUF6798 domain-containing protein, partial [Lacipirellulaceae bacterium]|nr:DUF6798 domain-containing protein [Lacipirellulaceae bacterium]
HDTTLAAGDAPTHLADLDGLDRIMRFATFALIGNCLGLAINIAGGRFPDAAAPLLRYYWFRQADVTTPLAVALGSACFAAWLAERGYAAGRVAVAAVVLLCSSHLGRIVLDRWRHPAPPGVARMEHPEAWIATCQWIAAHAPPDAVCLIPRHAQSFKWYAQRADVGNWKDVPQDAASVVAWRQRMADLFPTVATPAGQQVLGSPEQWGARRALDAAQRYGATFIVAGSEPPLGLREVFTAVSPETGQGYSVYAAPKRRQEPPP